MGISSPAQPVLAPQGPLRLSGWLSALLAIPILIVLGFAVLRPVQVLPRIGLAPAFSLTDQAGNRVTSEDLRAGLTLYTFTHSECGEPCAISPAVLDRVAQSLAGVDTAGLPLTFAALYFDGERASGSSARTDPVWRQLTGDAAQLKNVIRNGFGVYYAPTAEGGYTFDPVYVLVDGWGIMRAIYRSAEPDPAILRRDVQLIVREFENSTGVNRYAYEAAHLFLCYPR